MTAKGDASAEIPRCVGRAVGRWAEPGLGQPRAPAPAELRCGGVQGSSCTAADGRRRFVLQEQDVETVHGSVHVTMCGTPRGNRPAILTYHDIGLNRK